MLSQPVIQSHSDLRDPNIRETSLQGAEKSKIIPGFKTQILRGTLCWAMLPLNRGSKPLSSLELRGHKQKYLLSPQLNGIRKEPVRKRLMAILT